MKTVLLIFGTRPEVIKLAPVLSHLRQSRMLRPLVCVTAQHRQMLDQMLRTFAIQPDFDLDLMTEGQSLADLTARMLCGITDTLRRARPDFLLVQGDTTSCFVGALAAFYEAVPVGHIEAGLRTYDDRAPFPEELNRRLTSHLCSLHFAPTARARSNLVREGIAEETIFVTGNTIVDSLNHMISQSNPAPDIPGICWERDWVILVTVHRRENWAKIDAICEGLLLIVQSDERIHILLPVHANPRLGKPFRTRFDQVPRIHLLPCLPYPHFVSLMQRCRIVITDSGGIQEEVVSLNKPVVILRETTERPEILQSGHGVLAGTNPSKVVRIVRTMLDTPPPPLRKNPFGDGHAAERIVQRLECWLQPS